MPIPRDDPLTREVRETREELPARGIHSVKQVEGSVLALSDITPVGIGAAPSSHGHLKHNLGATSDPAVTDDVDAGYSTGSIWVNISTPKIFQCVTAAAGAADWNQIDASGGGGSLNTDTLWAALGDLVYGTGDDSADILSGNTTTTKKFLRQTGDGAASAVPAWDTIVAGDLPVASKTAKGIVELATTAEIDTGADTGRAMPVDQFVASDRNIRFITFRLIDVDTDCAVEASIGGDFVIPFTGTLLQSDSDKDWCSANVDTAGVTGTMVVDIHKGGSTVMTTNKLDIETTEKSTNTATTQPDLTTTAVAAGDIFTFDIDAIHTTAAKGLSVTIAIRLT